MVLGARHYKRILAHLMNVLSGVVMPLHKLDFFDEKHLDAVDVADAAAHPHNIERQTFIERDGVTQPAPAPRFSRTEAEVVSSPAWPGQHTRDVFVDWGVDAARIDAAVESGAIKQAG